jgi:NDP-sugar pyrophosphorylase family protein
MKAMILAGGLSTRLYPLTRQVPKPLVPVAGEPNAVHLIRYLKSYGYDHIAINVFYLPDAIHAALGDGSAFGVRLEYLHEPVLLGSAGALKQMAAFFSDGPFVVVGCDDLTDLPLDVLAAFHRERNAIATIGLVERDRVDQYGVVVTDERGKIREFQEKPAPGTERSRKVNTGIYYFEPEIFERIPANEFFDFGKDVFPGLQRAGAAFYGYDAAGAYWCDIGTPDEYRRASRDVLEGRFAVVGARATGADPTAYVAPTARVEGPVWIGRDAFVEDGAIVVGPSVIGDRVRIEANARIEASILWSGASIGSDARLTRTIVGNEYVVAPGASLDDAIVANEG